MLRRKWIFKFKRQWEDEWSRRQLGQVRKMTMRSLQLSVKVHVLECMMRSRCIVTPATTETKMLATILKMILVISYFFCWLLQEIAKKSKTPIAIQ